MNIKQSSNNMKRSLTVLIAITCLAKSAAEPPPQLETPVPKKTPEALVPEYLTTKIPGTTWIADQPKTWRTIHFTKEGTVIMTDSNGKAHRGAPTPYKVTPRGIAVSFDDTSSVTFKFTADVMELDMKGTKFKRAKSK